jgi:hypothetical protein
LAVLVVLTHGLNLGQNVGVLILGLEDLNVVGHDLLLLANTNLNTLHNLDFNTKNTLAELDVTDGNIDEVLLWLTS